MLFVDTRSKWDFEVLHIVGGIEFAGDAFSTVTGIAYAEKILPRVFQP